MNISEVNYESRSWSTSIVMLDARNYYRFIYYVSLAKSVFNSRFRFGRGLGAEM